MKSRKIGIVLSYGSTILSMLCGLFLSSYLLRMLGQTDYGIYQTVCSFANYLVLLEFGTGTVITRNIARCRVNSRPEDIQKNVSTVWAVNMILAVLLVLAAVVFYSIIPTLYAKTLSYEQIVYARKIFALEAVYLVVSFFVTVPQGILLGFEQYQLPPIVNLIRLILRTLALTLLVFYYRLAIIIVCVDLAISVMVFAFEAWYCKSRFQIRFSIRGFDKQIFLDALPLCMAIFIQCLVNQANSNVDKFVLGIRLSPESVSVYSVGLYIYSIFSSLTTIPISMYAPQIVQEVEKGTSGRELEKFLIQPSRLIVLVGGTILFGFVSVGKQFIELVYGAEYTVAWVVALIIMFPMLLNMSNGILINVLDATNRRLARSYVLGITTIANIVLTLLWVDRWGMIGASIATAVCTIVGQITLMNIYYSKKMKINVLYMYRETFRGILGYQVIASSVAYLIASRISNVVVALLVGCLAYVFVFAVLFLCKGAKAGEKALVMRILPKLRRME